MKDCKDSKIMITASNSENDLLHTIKDNGIGTEKDKLDDIFMDHINIRVG